MRAAGCRLAFGLLVLLSAHPTSAQEPPVTPRAADVKAAVRQILSSPEYGQRSGEPSLLEKIGKPISDGLRRAGQAIMRWLRRLQFHPGESGLPPVLPQVLAALFLALLIVGLAWAVVGLVRLVSGGTRAGPKTKRPAVVEEPDEETDESVPVDTWLDAARRHAAAGDFRHAYRAVFLAILLRLDEAGAIRFQRARTNGEYLRALRAKPPLREALLPTARDFDLHWYGQVAVGEEDYDRMTSSYRDVVARLGAP